MPKVSTTELQFLGKNRKFEVHYSARSSAFFVKLPPEITSVITDDPERDSEAKAIERGQELLRKYEASQANRRKVIVVHIPEARGRNWRTNNVALSAVGFEIAYRVLEEVTTPGESPHYIAERGRAEYLPADGFTAIPWTEEREEFFKQFTDRMEAARGSLLAFVRECGKRPELCTFATMPALMPNATAEEAE